MLVQPGLCRTWSEATLLAFPRGGSNISLLLVPDFFSAFDYNKERAFSKSLKCAFTDHYQTKEGVLEVEYVMEI